jgi:hypothetical protein
VVVPLIVRASSRRARSCSWMRGTT